MESREKIQKIIEQTGKTQTELATLLGVSFVTLNAWIHGKSVPRKNAQAKIDELYDKYTKVLQTRTDVQEAHGEDGDLITELRQILARMIAETNGITLMNTLHLLQANTPDVPVSPRAQQAIDDFSQMVFDFQVHQGDIEALLDHPFSHALFGYFKSFPLPFHEQHTHLTGSLDEEFVFPRLMKVLAGEHADTVKKQAMEVYEVDLDTIKSPEDLRPLMRLQEGHAFVEYLRRIFLTKVVLTSLEAHRAAAYHMAKMSYEQFNVGFIRLKWQFSRVTNTGSAAEDIPGLEDMSPEDITLALYEGFMDFQKEQPIFDFQLCPIFRKEANYYDAERFATKKDDIKDQVNRILNLRKKHSELLPHLNSVDTAGNEVNEFSKTSYVTFKDAFQKLKYNGFQIRSHHGETWKTLRRGIQSVDNALNIWAADAIEHGVSLGVNPNYYFHRLFQTALQKNLNGEAIDERSPLGEELNDMDWRDHTSVVNKLFAGEKLNEDEIRQFTKTKFHTSGEVERYQHDVLNRMIDSGVELISLPSSNYKLTSQFGDYKEHPFSWWEKKGMKLSIGTDNYVILDSNFIREMIILLYTDAANLKITKLLMVATGETRRPYMSNILWQVNKEENL